MEKEDVTEILGYILVFFIILLAGHYIEQLTGG